MNVVKTRPLAALTTAFAILALASTALAGHGTHGTISAGKLARDAKDFYGKTVTVKAEVEKVIDGHSFTLDEDALFAGPDVLVLLPNGVARNLRHDDKVIVTGVVRQFLVAELERDFDFFEDDAIIKSDVDVDFKTRPVLIASALQTADGRDLLATTTMATTGTAKLPAPLPAVTIGAGRLVKDARDFYGKTVTVKAEVEKVLSDHSFTLDEDALFKGPDVLVLVPSGVARSLRHDDMVTVTGMVRQYVIAELERDLDFFDEGKIIDVDTKVDYKTRPVIVATSLLTADGRDLMAGVAVR